MRIVALLAGTTALATAALAADDCKFCATEVVVSASQIGCLKQRVDEALRDIGAKNTAVIDLVSCGGQAGGAPQSGISPRAPAPVAGAAPPGAPMQVFRLTKPGLECVQRRLVNPPTGQDPVHLPTTCP